MKYFFAVRPPAPDKELPNEEEDWAPEGEPVVPRYPSVDDSAFIASPSFKRAPYAEVLDVPDFDPDELHESLVKEFPGIPPLLHQNYIVALATLADECEVGTRFQVFITQNTAKVRNTKNDALITLWDKQPITTELKRYGE